MVNNISNPSITGLEVQSQGQAATAKVQQIELNTKKEDRSSKVDSLDKKVDDPNKGVATLEEIESAVNELNDRVAKQELSVAFGVDEKSGRIVVKISDNKTGELIRQVPSEETLRFAQNVKKGIGVLVDSKF